MKNCTRLSLLILLLAPVLVANSQDFNADFQQATDYYYARKYTEAALLFEKWVPGKKEEFGRSDTSVYLKLVGWAGTSYFNAGNYEKAEPLMEEALSITRENFGPDHPDYTIRLNNLAQLYQEMGCFEQAELMMKEVLQVDIKNVGGDNHDYAIDLNNLAQLYQQMGRLEQAEPLMQEALRINKEKLGEDHPSYAINLNNLGMLYNAMGCYEEAEPLVKEALRIDKEKFGQDHDSYARDVNNLAHIYKAMGRLKQAEPLIQEALSIDREYLGEDHPGYAKDLNNLAQLYIEMNLCDKAYPLMQETLKIIKEKQGENHPQYAIALNSLALLYLAMGRSEQAKPLMKEAFGIFQNQVKNNTGYLSGKELEKFLDTYLNELETFQSFNILESLRDSLGNAGSFAFDIELNRKGMALQAAENLRTRILASGDTSLINNYLTLITLRKQIDQANSTSPYTRTDDMEKLEIQANELEKNLTLKSQDYSRSIEEVNITWKKVQKQVKPGEAVIEFSSFRFYNKRWTDSTYYCALVLRPEYTTPKMVFLFEERSLSDILNKTAKDIDPTRKVIGMAIECDSLHHSDFLYQLIFKPVGHLLDGVKTLYYVPTGMLNNISFPSLAIRANEKLAGQYVLNCLISSKNLITKQ